MNLWVVIIAAGILTYLIRLSFILLLSNKKIPDLAKRGLRFVPPAVFSAIIVPELFTSSGQIAITLGNFRLAAGIIAAIVAWRTKNAFLTIIVGMLVLWILQYLFNPQAGP